MLIGYGVPPLAKGCFSESSATASALLAPRHLVDLGEFTGAGAAVEFINRFLGEVLPPGDVDRREPTLLSPAPSSACCHADLFQPAGEADYSRAGNGVRHAVRFNFHTPHPAAPSMDVGVSETQGYAFKILCA